MTTMTTKSPGLVELFRRMRERARADRLLIMDGVCPKCKQPGVTCRRDDRQSGEHGASAGEWCNVRHAACGLMVDIVFPTA